MKSDFLFFRAVAFWFFLASVFCSCPSKREFGSETGRVVHSNKDIDIADDSILHVGKKLKTSGSIFLESFSDSSSSIVNNPPRSFLYLLDADALLYAMEFLIPCSRDLSNALITLKYDLAVKLFYLIAILSAKAYLPLSIDRCIGTFSLNELLVLKMVAPEIIESFKRNRLPPFLDSLSLVLQVYHYNVTMLSHSNANPNASNSSTEAALKFFFKTLTDMESNFYSSWEDRCKFSEKYFLSVRTVEYKYLQIVSKYLSHNSVISLAGKSFYFENFDDKTNFFSLGMMLTCKVPRISFKQIFEKIISSDAAENLDAVIEGFLTANNDPSVYTDVEMRITKARNEIFVNRRVPILQNKEFSLVNTLKFGTLADVEALDRSRVLAIFDRLFVVDKIYYLALIRRPVLKDFWCKMSEDTEYFDDINGLLNVDYISKNAQCFDDTFDKMFLTNYCKPDEDCLKSFTAAVKNYVLNNDEVTLLDNANNEDLPTKPGYNSLIYCFVDAVKKREFHLCKPLFHLFHEIYDWNTDICFPRHPIIYREYLRSMEEDLFLDLKSKFVFIASLVTDDRVTIKLFYNYFLFTPDASNAIFEKLLKSRYIPIIFIRKFLLIWARCTDKELTDLFQSRFLFDSDSRPINFDINTPLSRLLQTLWEKTNARIQYNVTTRTQTHAMSNILYPELWYFYFYTNESGFKESCPLFEKYFSPIPGLTLTSKN